MSFLQQDTRTHVVGELYDTERSYVESLQVLVEKYMKPLKSVESNRILIDSNLVDEIFYTIPEILEHHETFLSALQHRLSSDWDTSQVIGDVFIEAFTNQQIIDTYTAFINNWKNARQAIKVATQARPAFERFLEAMSREHRNKLTLDALLIMPVQRIPRYELLIKELIKHTPDDHPDYGPLIEAQKQIHELALKIDRAEREMIHQEQLKDIECLIEGHVELQHPQRDFIRYDLVTILGASALTVAKKERVIFLFCDLLIMTSVKKKASRRSNLQAAFANSSNDLSLLEGNKFKLLLRVPLDQVEVRLSSDQIQQQQQQQDQQNQAQLQQQSKLFQARKRDLEADLYILHQMTALSSKMNIDDDRNKINETINEIISQLKEKLAVLEQKSFDVQQAGMLHQAQHPIAAQLVVTSDPLVVAGSSCSSSVVQSSPTTIKNGGSANASNAAAAAAAAATTTLTAPPPTTTSTSTATSNIPAPPPPPPPIASIQQGDRNASNQDSHTNTSLEFLIGSSRQDSSHCQSPITLASGDLGAGSADAAASAADAAFAACSAAAQQESLIVTFGSPERHQAFLQAFMDAKQQRRQRQHQQRMYSTSTVLRMSGSPDSRARSANRHLSHQDNVAASSPVHGNGAATKQQVAAQRHQAGHANNAAATSRIASAPLHHQHQTSGAPTGGATCTIIHQMSAPQSLSLASGDSANPSQFQCNFCLSSGNLTSDAGDLHHDHHHHHHHQLMHQPNSQPASLDTICCHEPHGELTAARLSLASAGNRRSQYQDDIELLADGNHDYHNYQQQQVRRNIQDNNYDLTEQRNHQLQPTTTSGGAKQLPKFILTMPMNFLNTQHPALQFTCSALRNASKLHSTRQQQVRDNAGQLWLCMSNGYVSHIALISIRRKGWLQKGSAGAAEEATALNQAATDSRSPSQWCYSSIVPIIQSAGDICKSHINCAAQVRLIRRRGRARGRAGAEAPPPPPIEQSAAAAQLQKEGGSSESSGGPQDYQKSLIGKQTAADSELPRAPPTSEPRSAKPAATASEPMNIKVSSGSPYGARSLQLSESAPSPHSSGAAQTSYSAGNNNYNNNRSASAAASSSASTQRLEVPSPSDLGGSIAQMKSNLQQQQQQQQQHVCAPRQTGRKRSQAVCQYGGDNLKSRGACVQSYAARLPTMQQQQQALGSRSSAIPNNHLYHHHHHHHHHLHHHHHHSHHHSHLHAGHHHHAGGAHHHHHHVYGVRHHTVPIAELRRALERQNRVSELHFGAPPSPAANNHSNWGKPPAAAATISAAGSRGTAGREQQAQQSSSAQDLSRNTEQANRDAGVPVSQPASKKLVAAKSFRSARLLRHQASLKTSSILAKLVSSASKRSSSYLAGAGRKSPTARDKQSSDADDIDTDTDSGMQPQQQPQHQQHQQASKQEDQSSIDSNILAITTPGANKYLLNAPHGSSSDVVISPLSSVSSLTSTNSSITVNSVCASSPNRSTCDLLTHSLSTTCCNGITSSQQHHSQIEWDMCAPPSRRTVLLDPCGGHRSRSATVPSRSLFPVAGGGGDSMLGDGGGNKDGRLSTEGFRVQHGDEAESAGESTGGSAGSQPAYKVSEIIRDNKQAGNNIKDDMPATSDATGGRNGGAGSSLWLGCDDGSLLIINCLSSNNYWHPNEDCNYCELNIQATNQALNCRNVHSEIKLGAAICDICTYKDVKVFVALSNGQLAIFVAKQPVTTTSSSTAADSNKDNTSEEEEEEWNLTSPIIITVTTNELNSTSKLCLIDDNYLWYAYGKNIFVLNVTTLKLETTIMVPTNDPSLQFTIQSISIDSMVLMNDSFGGVWISFKNSHSIQLYDVRGYKLLAELNLFEPINRMLSHGNEIIRQHKTACIRATSLLNINNARERRNTLFIGTSAGIVLYLNITDEQLMAKKSMDMPLINDLIPQVASLRHGHSGHVKFMHIIELDNDDPGGTDVYTDKDNDRDDDNNQQNESTPSDMKEVFLISGGVGVDLYGPNDEQQQSMHQANSDVDSLNHLLLWQL